MATNNTQPKPVDYDGQSPDEIYRDLVRRAGLYGKAFFGHRTTKSERNELTRLFGRAKRLAGQGQPTLAEVTALEQEAE